MELEVIQNGLLIFLVYLCVYAIVNRICKCIETCAMHKNTTNHTIDTINRIIGKKE